MIPQADVPSADVLIVTATKVESQAVLDAFAELTGQPARIVTENRRTYRDLGAVGGTRVFLALTEMGAAGLGGSQQAVQKGIAALHPGAVLLVGIAFGMDEKKQRIGDILISQQLQLYDLQRIGADQILLRGDKPHASPRLIDYFRQAHLDWDESKAKVEFGLILSGEKLVDNRDYREQLQRLAPEALGGEMEGAGLYVACQDAQVDWIVVKAICDWADGHKKRNKTARQRSAAGNAAAFVVHALQQAPLKRPELPLEPPPATIQNTGSGAVATQGGVAAGAGGVAVGGDVHGDIHVHPAPASETLGPEVFNLERGNRSPDAAGLVYPVWFGTNRKPAGDGFTGERHDRTTLGRALVYVPEAHRFGETGTNFWRRLLRFDLRDDRLRLQGVERREREAFFGEINEAMRTARDTGEAPHALFFLHGYNVTFEDAAIRAAQLGVDLKVPGATAFFSWPSRGSVAAYPADEATIEASEPAITAFLVDFTANCGAEKVHVIAHSMGNRGLLRALQRIAADAQTRGKVKFGQIFLAAPDVDRDLFLNLARLYPEHAERATLYASDGDKAVHLSAKLHDAPRAGYFMPYTVAPGVDTVTVPDFDIDLLGHGYFAQAEALLHDIYDLMRHGQSPEKRQRIIAAEDQGASFWKLRR